jgi:AraC family transcriptional activator of pobA
LKTATQPAISTIAYALGFNDPAYFSRVFSSATGRSPHHLRAAIHRGT